MSWIGKVVAEPASRPEGVPGDKDRVQVLRAEQGRPEVDPDEEEGNREQEEVSRQKPGPGESTWLAPSKMSEKKNAYFYESL